MKLSTRAAGFLMARILAIACLVESIGACRLVRFEAMPAGQSWMWGMLLFPIAFSLLLAGILWRNADRLVGDGRSLPSAPWSPRNIAKAVAFGGGLIVFAALIGKVAVNFLHRGPVILTGFAYSDTSYFGPNEGEVATVVLILIALPRLGRWGRRRQDAAPTVPFPKRLR
ncbi:MAG TPA: hypothetical protein VHE55_01700 [Fimbriimonadaceae bacterium]|nr:hypothetical protein [Fimbriimonadaceae bacterium]